MSTGLVGVGRCLRRVNEDRLWWAVPVACLTLLTGLSSPGMARSQTGSWVAGWEAPAHGSQGVYIGAAPQTASYPNGFTNQTLRLIITPHAPGAEARIVLSNVFGTKSITITAVTIAAQAHDASVERDSIRRLTFSGRRSVRIPEGRQVLSDPTSMRVRPFHNLSVSLAVNASTGPPTYHYNGLQTSYISPVGSGNQSSTTSGDPFSTTTPMRFFLADLQVLDSPQARTVVAAGDSITDGGDYEPDTANRNTRWPDLLQRRLLAAHSNLSVANAGISANQITHGPDVVPEGGPSLQARFQRDVLSQPNLSGIILLEGINDIGLSNASAPTVIAGMKRIAQRAHAAGVRIMIGTLLPFQGAFDYSATKERTRAQVNAWILHQHVYDATINFAAAVQDPTDPLRLRPSLDSGDHLHPNAKGFTAMANAISLRTVRRLFGGTGTR